MVDTHLLDQIVTSAALVAVSGLFFEALGRLLQSLARRGGARLGTTRGIRDGLRLIWIAVLASGLVYIWNLASLFTVLTISGIAGLVLSLSLQAVFSNMIAGLMLLQDKAIGVGDRIEFSGVKGIVIRVALRNTWVRTDEGKIAIIGNSALTAGPLINHSAAARMSIELTEP